MVLSFQFKKHLSLGRGGAILCEDYKDYISLKKMSYDGRISGMPWEDQDIDTIGYHYYMTPETAILGLEKLSQAIKNNPTSRDWTTYPDLSKLKVFHEHK
jgi:dTDP-4-amino-4,6-dideoxygalactose transaminase